MAVFNLTRTNPCGPRLQQQATHRASASSLLFSGRDAQEERCGMAACTPLSEQHGGARVAATWPPSSWRPWVDLAVNYTVVRASQRGPHPTPPIAVSEAWVAAQRAWVDLAVNQPAELSGTDAKGVAWSSSVHLLGITHNSAANARPVYEVAVAVKPDAVGSENDSSDKTARNRVTKAALSAPMMKLVLGSWTRPSKATSRHTGSSLQSSAKSGRTVGT
ncbi:hypothetical protein FOA52_007425 [Chlamydomonas sp. UWO 241]|nr:hypothetical protein FOA52_007425 [Chlamydomonas sp. UWO 241]